MMKKLLLEQLKHGLALAETATATDCLDMLGRMLADDAPRRGQPTLTQRLARLLDLGTGATAETVLATIKQRLAEEAERAIRWEQQEEKDNMNANNGDPRAVAFDRARRLTEAHALPFDVALRRVRREDPQLSEQLDDYYGRPVPTPATPRPEKWDRQLVERGQDPRQELADRAYRRASERGIGFSAALAEVAREDVQLAESAATFLYRG